MKGGGGGKLPAVSGKESQKLRGKTKAGRYQRRGVGFSDTVKKTAKKLKRQPAYIVSTRESRKGGGVDV